MKNDVSYDFKKFKLIKNQWASIIIIGYLYGVCKKLRLIIIRKLIIILTKTPSVRNYG